MRHEIQTDLLESHKTAEIRQLKAKREELNADLAETNNELKKRLYANRGEMISRDGRVVITLMDRQVFFYEMPTSERGEFKIIGSAELELLEKAIMKLKHGRVQ